jgi:hypothetical protein
LIRLCVDPGVHRVLEVEAVIVVGRRLTPAVVYPVVLEDRTVRGSHAPGADDEADRGVPVGHVVVAELGVVAVDHRARTDGAALARAAAGSRAAVEIERPDLDEARAL